QAAHVVVLDQRAEQAEELVLLRLAQLAPVVDHRALAQLIDVEEAAHAGRDLGGEVLLLLGAGGDLLLEQAGDRVVGGLDRLRAGAGLWLGSGRRDGDAQREPGREKDEEDRSAKHGSPGHRRALYGRRPPARNSPAARSRRTTATFHWKTACA